MEGRTHDLGNEFTLSEHIEGGELVGYFVTGPKSSQCKSSYKGRCGGLCAIKPYSINNRAYSVWQVTGEWPNITLKPSVACNCSGQHGFVTGGVWTNA